MNKMLRKILTWEPTDLFWTDESYFDHYDPTYPNSFERRGNPHAPTPIGAWIKSKPPIFEIVKVPYYVIAYSLWFVLHTLILVVSLFLPRNTFKL